MVNINFSVMLLAVFVDNFLIVSANDTVIAHVKMLLNKKYGIKDKGVDDYFLSVRIRQRPRRITIDQKQCIRTVLDNYQQYIDVVTMLIYPQYLHMLHMIPHPSLPYTLRDDPFPFLR